MSRHYRSHPREQERLRVVAFAFLTPFFFVKGGLAVSLSAVWTSLGALGLLVAAKMIPKLAGISPVARRTLRGPGEAWFGTLLMSTGLTFGTITPLYGLNVGIVDRTQFSLLMTVIVGSAIVPTLRRPTLVHAAPRTGADRHRRAPRRRPRPRAGRCPGGPAHDALRAHHRRGRRT